MRDVSASFISSSLSDHEGRSACNSARLCSKLSTIFCAAVERKSSTPIRAHCAPWPVKMPKTLGAEVFEDACVMLRVGGLKLIPSTKASSLEQRSSTVNAENDALLGKVDLREFSV